MSSTSKKIGSGAGSNLTEKLEDAKSPDDFEYLLTKKKFIRKKHLENGLEIIGNKIKLYHKKKIQFEKIRTKYLETILQLKNPNDDESVISSL